MNGTTIINTHDQLVAAVSAGIITKSQAVCIGYAAGEARQGRSPRWEIYSPYFATNPEAHFMDGGKMIFIVSHRADRKPVFRLAQFWAEEKYGIKEWARNRLGNYVPKTVNDKLPIPKREAL